MIIFENITQKNEEGGLITIGISRENDGKHYRAKISAAVASSNMSINADRGQDFGWRLIPEQQALIERWESDPEMIEKVSIWSKVMIDDLTHAEFLAYLIYQQELGKSPERAEVAARRDQQADYERRVAELRAATEVAAEPAFDPETPAAEQAKTAVKRTPPKTTE